VLEQVRGSLAWWEKPTRAMKAKTPVKGDRDPTGSVKASERSFRGEI
jgi:hypothetical protein